MNIQRLSSSNVAEYRRLRLRGLRESPAAFGSSYAEEAKLPRKAFVARLEQTEAKWVFGAFENKRLVGVVTLIRERHLKEKHKASIYGMYVDRRMRRQGIGRLLLDRVIQTARGRPKLRQVRLAVVEGNDAALQLYLSSGFKVYGREEDALTVRGKFYAELFLALRL
jgi:ribosomal protein S18 acetylase RimI-like enzyme